MNIIVCIICIIKYKKPVPNQQTKLDYTTFLDQIIRFPAH